MSTYFYIMPDSVTFDIHINPNMDNIQELRDIIKKEIQEEMKRNQGNENQSGTMTSMTPRDPNDPSAWKKPNKPIPPSVSSGITPDDIKFGFDALGRALPSGTKNKGNAKWIRHRTIEGVENLSEFENNPTEKPTLEYPRQPIQGVGGDEEKGGIFGDKYDPNDVTFQKGKQVRGGVKRERDDRSNAPIEQERWIEQQKRLEDMYEKVTGKRISGFTGLLTDGNSIGDMIFGDKGDDKLAAEVNKIGNKLFGREGEKKIGGTVDKYMTKNSQRLGIMAGTISNPQVMGPQLLTLLSGFGPYGAAALAAITAIIVAPQTVQMLIKMFGQKGLFLNQDFRRVVEEEVNGLLNIEDKKKRMLGIDSYIITQVDDFQPASGAYVYNSWENRDELILNKVGQAEKTVGIR